MEGESWSHESEQALLSGERVVSHKLKNVWSGFLDFALRENVLEVAVGLIIAAAFTAVVNSLVSDVLIPPLALLPFMARNLEEKFVILRRGPHFTSPLGYNTRQQAADDGAVILMYGAFLDKVVNFIGIGIVLYLIANIYGYYSEDSIIKHSFKCQYCRKEISAKAKRCPLCTTWMDGREEKETSAVPHEAGQP